MEKNPSPQSAFTKNAGAQFYLKHQFLYQIPLKSTNRLKSWWHKHFNAHGRVFSRDNQANNTNLISSFSTRIANLTALKTEAPFSLVTTYYSKVSSQN